MHLIVNFDATPAKIEEVYPKPFNRAPKEGKIGPFLFGYHELLDSAALAHPPEPDIKTQDESDLFWSGTLQSYRPHRTAYDNTFRDFLNRSGTADNVVFCVKAQVDNGPMLYTKYYTLTDGNVVEVEGPFSQKLHAYKNYKCPKHDRFYGVDLYKANGTSGHNSHHMRPSAFTLRNDSLLDAFLTEAGL